MITSGGSPLDLKFNVALTGATLERTSIQTVSIELAENMHNIATMEVAGIPPQYLTEYLNLPITISVAVGSQSSYTFYGYVYSLEPVSKNKDGLVNKSPFQTTRVVCFGATYSMRGKRTRSWENYTLAQIAKELADKYSFSVSVPNDPFVFSRFVQAEKSDWQTLVEAANYLGYRVWSTGTNIDIWDPYSALSRIGSRPMYAMSGNQGALNARAGQVLKFTAQVGSAVKTADTIHALVDNDIFTLSFNESSGYGRTIQSPYQDEVAENAVSVDMAEAALKGRNRNKMSITANVEVVSDPSIRPGMVISLQKYDSGIDGFWIVKSARHEMFRGSAMSYVELMRDSVITETVNPTVVTSPPPEAPEPRLINNRWRTSTEQIHIYG